MRLCCLTLGAFAVMFAWAPPAAGAVSCSYSAPKHLLSVRLTAGGDRVLLERDPFDDEEIWVSTTMQLDCAGPPPTVHNVDLIRLNDLSRGVTEVGVLDPEEFTPGASSAGGDAGRRSRNEIEFRINLGRGKGDTIAVRNFGLTSRNDWRYGRRGMNPNLASERRGAHDADIFFSGVERHHATTGSRNDRISGAGGAGTGSPLRARLIGAGEYGDDRLIGGLRRDLLRGTWGRDRLYGAGGPDWLLADDGADLLSGGRGRDTVEWPYGGFGSEVRADIGAGGANDGADRDRHRDRVLPNVENLVGGNEADILIGDRGPNRLEGNDRNDRLIGRGGADRLIGEGGQDVFFGGLGNDLLDARYDDRDRRIDCGPGSDRARRDALDPPGLSC